MSKIESTVVTHESGETNVQVRVDAVIDGERVIRRYDIFDSGLSIVDINAEGEPVRSGQWAHDDLRTEEGA